MAAYLIPDREFGPEDLRAFDLIMVDYPTFNQIIESIETAKGERHYYGEDTKDGKEYVAMTSGGNSKIQLIRPTLKSETGKMLTRDLIKEFGIRKYTEDGTDITERPIENLYLFMYS